MIVVMTGHVMTLLMMALGTLVLGATSVSSQAGSTALPGIIGEDGRRRIDSGSTPWNAIGRVNRRFGGFCTGVLVGPDRVLTAAHCLFNPRTSRWPEAKSLHFVAGYRRSENIAHAPGVATDHTHIDVDRRGRPRNIADDWAYVTLSKTLAGPRGSGVKAGSRIDPFPFYTGRLSGLAGKKLILAAYHQDAAHILSVETGCRIVGIFDGGKTFTHTCDSTKGASGAPIFVEEEGELRIVGITVGILKRDGRAVGIGVRPGIE